MTAREHHDGSERYVSDPAPSLGSTVTVFLRIPHAAGAAGANRVFVRTSPDAEPKFAPARIDRTDEHETWWRADITMVNPVMRYRFLLEGGPSPYRWVNALGTFERDVTDGADFWLTSFAAPPRWLDDTVVYQVFPDRFASSGATRSWPSWAVATPWDQPIADDWRISTHQLYGGDLDGLVQRLDHITALGANAIYLTPFFPAESAHRYNASSFDRVDPLLGGDDALVRLTHAAHDRGIRIIGDLTTNHTGDTHEWFRRAQQDRTSPEAGFYHFGSDEPDDYVGWFGVKTLPKLDHRSPELMKRMLTGPDSVTGHWLRPPYELDAWRIDVANMTGRLADIDTNLGVARQMRATIAGVRPDAWLVAEHCYDASADLRGDGWHGTMNYSGFSRPAWCWLRDPASDSGLLGYPSPPPALGGAAIVATMRDFVAAMPWRSTAASMTLLGSHDTARWPSVAGGPARQLAGLGLLMGYPGVPTVYYGDEVGIPGHDSDRGRAPMPWDRSGWDQQLLDGYRRLIAVRRSSSALQRGGLRWLHTGDDDVVFARESNDETVLVHVGRGGGAPVSLDLATYGLAGQAAGGLTTLVGDTDLAVDAGHATIVDTDTPAVHMWRIGS